MQEPILLAGCVLLDDYGRLLLLHRYSDEYGQWEVPGGKVEKDESPVDAAVREVYEELGVTVAVDRSLGSGDFEQDGTNYKYYWFAAKLAGGEPQVLETDKFDDLEYFELEDLPSLSLSEGMLTLQAKLVSGEVIL